MELENGCVSNSSVTTKSFVVAYNMICLTSPPNSFAPNLKAEQGDGEVDYSHLRKEHQFGHRLVSWTKSLRIICICSSDKFWEYIGMWKYIYICIFI